VRVEPKTIDVIVVTHNCYATRSMQFECQMTLLFELRRTGVSIVTF